MRLTGDQDVRRYLGGVAPFSVRLRHALRAQPAEADWTLTLRSTGRPIGFVAVNPHKDGRDLELSYQLIPAAWGQGLAFEATSAVLGWAQQADIVSMIAETQAANQRSCALLGRLGFTEEARLIRYGAEQVIFREML